MTRQTFKLLALMLLLSMGLSSTAQIIQENELAIVYYMPETQVEVELEYEQIEQKKGPFSAFAEEFLGIDDIIEQDEVNYQLCNAKLSTRTQADYSRAYKIVAQNNIDMQLLSMTDKGLLYGYNVEQEKPSSKPNNKKAEKCPVCKPMAPPYTEDQMKAQTLRQMAESIAKQIFRLRETRFYLLAGEVDNPPADGKAMQLVLKELDEQEQQLVELFSGSRTVTKKHHNILFTPETSEEKSIIYFSESEGIVAEDNATGTAVVLDIKARKQVLGACTTTPDKKAPKASQIYYNLPGTCELSLYYRSRKLAERQVTVAQFGVAVPLAENLFTGKELPKIYFNTNTGNILSITK